MKKQNNEKHLGKFGQFITKRGGLFIPLLSYGLMLGLALAGMSLMALCVIADLCIGCGSFGGFAFLTGGMVFTTACSMLVWKLTRDLEGWVRGAKAGNV